MSVSKAEFKSALSEWPSGVSVVTSRAEGVPVGMTVSAFSSASLDPPLILVCLDQRTATLAAIVETRYFAVNVLAQSQSGLSDRFSLEGNESVRFEQVPLLTVEAASSPLIAGALVHIDCRLEATHTAGDHVVCLGRVHLALRHAGQPLLFHASGYHRLAPL